MKYLIFTVSLKFEDELITTCNNLVLNQNQSHLMCRMCLFTASWCKTDACISLLQDKKATAFPPMSNKLSDQSEIEHRVLIDGNLITSRGPGTAMEFALTIVEKLFGRKLGLELAKAMVFTRA